MISTSRRMAPIMAWMMSANRPPPTLTPSFGSSQPAMNAPNTPTTAHNLTGQPSGNDADNKECKQGFNAHALLQS